MGGFGKPRRTVVLVLCESGPRQLTEHDQLLALAARTLSRQKNSVDPFIICYGKASRDAVADYLVTKLGVEQLRVSTLEHVPINPNVRKLGVSEPTESDEPIRPEAIRDYYCKLTGQQEQLRNARVVVVCANPWQTRLHFLFSGRMVRVQQCFP